MKELLVKQAACTHWSESTYKEEAESAYHKQECIATTSMARKVSIRSFEAGTEWKAKQSPWISVNEELPDNDDDLYIVLDIKLEPPACGVCDFDLNINKWVGAGGIIAHPTHWMPIPKFNE